MKRINYLLLGAAVLGMGMASCSQEDVTAPGAGDGYNITVKLPGDLATRAVNDGLKANNLYYAVYDADNNDSYVAKFDQSFNGELETTVHLNLTTGKKYKIVFFAVNDNAYNSVYNLDFETATMTVDYDAMNNEDLMDDYFDCFYQVEETGMVSQGVNKTIVLYRPIAQINWGTADMDNEFVKDAFGGDVAKNLETTLTVDAYNTLNLLDKTVDGQEEVILPKYNVPEDPYTFPVEGYEYVAMQYVLAPQTPGVYDLTLNMYNNYDPSSELEPVEVTTAPVQANYRTNIYGKLFTNPFEVIVDKDPTWGEPDYDIDQPTAEFLNACYNGGEIALSGDVHLPYMVKVTTTNPLTVDFNGYTIYGPSPEVPSTPYGCIYLGNASTVTFKGEGGISASTPDPSMAIWVNNKDAVVNIESGTYWSDSPYELLYIGPNGGKINISGGEFTAYKSSLCNIYDAAYKSGIGEFVITGGIFYGGNFNPAASKWESPAANFVPTGYESIYIPTIELGDVTTSAYLVAAEGSKYVSSQDELTAALSAGNSVVVGAGAYSIPVEIPAGVTVKGLGADKTVVSTPMAYNKGTELTFEDLTLSAFVNNANHTSMGFQGATSQTFNNVKFVGQFYVFSGTASFSGCDFVYNADTQRNSYGQLCIQQGNVNVENCSMTSGAAGGVYVATAWNATVAVAAPTVSIDGLDVTGTTIVKNPVVDINSTLYSGNGTITLANISYPQGIFTGLWAETNGNGNTTNVFNVTVK